MIFQKGDHAIIDGQEYKCIVADKDYAALSEVYSLGVNVENSRIYANYDGWEEHIVGLERIIKDRGSGV
jgi:hypothetical protein